MESVERLVGEYRVTAQISSTDAGTANTGTVFRAAHTGGGDEVVIRIFSPRGMLDQALLRRWEHGAAVLRTLQHPGLVGVLDAGIHDAGIHEAGIHEGQPYLVSAYLPGDSLRKKLGKPLPFWQAARLLIPPARALAYLHEHHLPHGNVHAGNIMLGKSFVLADAGVQQLAGLLQTRQGMPVASRKEDIQGIGKIFFEMVTGANLQKEAGMPEKVYSPESILNALNALPHTLPEKAAEVETFIRKTLLPGQPFENMTDVVGALEAIVGNDLQQARKNISAPGAAQTGLPDDKPSQRVVSNESSAAGTSLAAAESENPGSTPGMKPRQAGWGLIPITLLVAALVLGGFWLVNWWAGANAGNSLVAGLSQASATTAGQVVLASGSQAASAGTETVAASAAVTTGSPPAEASPTAYPIVQQVSEQDAMVQQFVPAGEFRMGSEDREEDEKPSHGVYLDAFWIDRTEVTNAQYAGCVEAEVCTAPVAQSSNQRGLYYDSPLYADYPVIFISWQQADAYCTWAERRLPTEAEWEKAARGSDGAICPWGDTSPTPVRLNYDGLMGDTTQVGSYPAGASPYGALDMAGNVWEWVADWYSGAYYQQADYENPGGPPDGSRRVLRGGSWYYQVNDIRAANRFSASENTVLNDVGFRCAQSAQ